MSYKGGKTADDDYSSVSTTSTRTSSNDNDDGDHGDENMRIPAAIGRQRPRSNPYDGLVGGKSIVGGKTAFTLGVNCSDEEDHGENLESGRDETDEDEQQQIQHENLESRLDEENGIKPPTDDDENEDDTDTDQTEDEDDATLQPQLKQIATATTMPNESDRTKITSIKRSLQLPLRKDTTSKLGLVSAMAKSTVPKNAKTNTGSNQIQLEAWKEVHSSLTRAVLVAKESIASKKLQRRFWLETICANLKHPNEALPTRRKNLTNIDLTAFTELPLLQPYSVWLKPDQRKKKRGPQKKIDLHNTFSCDTVSIGSTTSPTKKIKTSGKASLEGPPKPLSSMKKKNKIKPSITEAGGLKKRKKALLPTIKAKASVKKKKNNDTSVRTPKPKLRLSLSQSKIISKHTEPKAPAVPTLSVFQDDSDDDDEDNISDKNNEATINGTPTRASTQSRFTLKNYNDLASSLSSASSDNDSDNESDDNREEKPKASNGSDEKSTGTNMSINGETNEMDPDGNLKENDGDELIPPSPVWNTSEHKHPFLAKRRPSDMHRRGSTQGNLDSSEIYSTFGQEKGGTDKGIAGVGTSGISSSSAFGIYGAGDSSEDEIPF